MSEVQFPVLLKISILFALIAGLSRHLSVDVILPKFMKLDTEHFPAMFMQNMVTYTGKTPSAFGLTAPLIEVGPKGFLLVLTAPYQEEKITMNEFLAWYQKNLEWMNEATADYGGILFRGFPISSPVDFDNMIETLNPDMKAEIYLGTTPRFRVNGTKFIQTASEAPKFVSIPTHIELSFSKQPPKRIYFYAETINPPPGGHTPFTDFRSVWDNISPALKQQMLQRGLVYERWYRDESNYAIDPLVHKSWQSMFLTSNKTLVTAMAYEQGYVASWDDKNDLLLKHIAVIARVNEKTQREFWCTHYNVLHAATYAIPYAWDAQILNSKKSAFIAILMHLWVQGRHMLGYHYGSNTLYADNETDLSWDDAMHIRRVIANSTWMFAYEKGDVVMLDNHRIAHGRTPWYTGKRSVMVAYH
jgi:alpha-ketoglutarate-dependent taurine dioxygenase